jgi:voltage-gated potassium channel
MPRYIWRRGRDLRRRLYEVLEHGTIGNRTGLIVGRLIVALIITNLVTMTLDSVPALEAQYGPLFLAIELLSLVVFTIEYALRVWWRPSTHRTGIRANARPDGNLCRARSA